MINWLIERAKRTPYFHLAGYMNRFWLVPYNVKLWRSVDPENYFPLRAGQICVMQTTDGTGLVPWTRRPFARLLQTFGIAVRVHEILRSDAGRDPHDHPWPYLTVILRGGYYETRYYRDDEGRCVMLDNKWHAPGSILYRPANSWHKLWIPEGETCTTLFITGPKAQSWGFLVDGEKVPYAKYEGRN